MKILTNLNLSQNELQEAVLHQLAAAPENAVVGQIYFNTTDKKAYIYQETGWEVLGVSEELLAKIDGMEEGADKIKYDTLPAATADNVGEVAIYTGATADGLKTGLTYVVVDNGGTYAWEEVTPTITGGTTDSAEVIVTDGEITTNVRISSDANNAIQIKTVDGVQGLYVEATEVGSATTDEDGLMTSDDKAKLDSIEEGAQVNKLEGVQFNGADLTIDENKKVNVVIAEATADAAGLMAAADKAALDAAVAKNTEQDGRLDALEAKDLELVAKDEELAGKITALETKDTELVAKDEELAGKITALETKDGELVAEDERLAGLIADNAEDITELGTAKQDKLIAGTNITIGEDGKTINATIPTASADTLGGIKIGTGLAIDAETGVVNVTGAAEASSVKWENVTNKPSSLGTPIEGGTHTKITYDENGLVTAGADLTAEDIPDLSDEYITTGQKGAASGVATLDANGKINLEEIPDTLLGNVKYGGTVDPTTGVCTLVDGKILGADGVEYTELTITADNAANFRGYYFLATADGTLADIDFLVGDWCISNGSNGWAKVDNTDAVMGVKGAKEDTYRIGQVNITAANVGAVEANEAITGGTFAKVTVDEKGLVTAGEEKLTMADISDIGDLTTSYVALNQGEEAANKSLVTDEEGNVTTVAHKFVATVGDGTATTYTISHNMGTKDIIVQVSDATTFEVVYVNIAISDDNSITLNFEKAPAANAYRVIIIA